MHYALYRCSSTVSKCEDQRHGIFAVCRKNNILQGFIAMIRRCTGPNVCNATILTRLCSGVLLALLPVYHYPLSDEENAQKVDDECP